MSQAHCTWENGQKKKGEVAERGRAMHKSLVAFLSTAKAHCPIFFVQDWADNTYIFGRIVVKLDMASGTH